MFLIRFIFGDFWSPTRFCFSLLTFVEVLVSVARLYFGAELVPEALQLLLERLQARHCGLEKPRLNDAHVDPKVVDISPDNRDDT